jgi:hypothetical protein
MGVHSRWTTDEEGIDKICVLVELDGNWQYLMGNRAKVHYHRIWK